MDCLYLFAAQGTLKSLLQHHSSKASITLYSAFSIFQLSHPYMTSGKTIALTRQTLVGKVMSLLFNMLSSFVITFLLSSKYSLYSWLPQRRRGTSKKPATFISKANKKGGKKNPKVSRMKKNHKNQSRNK